MALSMKLKKLYVFKLSFQDYSKQVTMFNNNCEDYFLSKGVDMPKDTDEIVLALLTDEPTTLIIDARNNTIGINV